MLQLRSFGGFCVQLDHSDIPSQFCNLRTCVKKLYTSKKPSRLCETTIFVQDADFRSSHITITGTPGPGAVVENLTQPQPGTY